MDPTFSVVIPTFGRPAFLAEAIASVLGQTFDDFECIVVDDASPEPASLPADPRLRLVRREQNGGPPAARNTGIDAAKGRYVAFLDDDDVWASERLSDALDAHQRAPVAVCWQSTLGVQAPATGRVLEGDVSDSVLDGIIPHLGATSVERAHVQHFDERYEASDDVEWWLRLAQELRVATTPRVGLLYRVHQGARPRTGQRKRLENGYMLLEEHAEWFGRHPRAKAFRMMRMGLSATRIGDRRAAIGLLTKSFRLNPKPRTAWHALRAIVARPEPSPSS
ncbi:MAG TPA: glycosyltransferase family 2 protein [Acidimicrobiia bacterium]|nr:glycosyltransferase family 2 protein [Acidimicrobiia bacterium]